MYGRHYFAHQSNSGRLLCVVPAPAENARIVNCGCNHTNLGPVRMRDVSEVCYQLVMYGTKNIAMS